MKIEKENKMKMKELTEKLESAGIHVEKLGQTKKFNKENFSLIDEFDPSKPVIIFSRGYFYHHGMTAEGYGAGMKKALIDLGLNVNLIAVQDSWKAWPGTSYLKAYFQFQS